MWAWPGSRDHDNSTVQTAAMGQIPRSTERILVIGKVIDKSLGARFFMAHCVEYSHAIGSLWPWAGESWPVAYHRL